MGVNFQTEPVTNLARRAVDDWNQNRYRSPHDPELIAYRKELEEEQKRLGEARRKRPSFEQRVMERLAKKKPK